MERRGCLLPLLLVLSSGAFAQESKAPLSSGAGWPVAISEAEISPTEVSPTQAAADSAVISTAFVTLGREEEVDNQKPFSYHLSGPTIGVNASATKVLGDYMAGVEGAYWQYSGSTPLDLSGTGRTVKVSRFDLVAKGLRRLCQDSLPNGTALWLGGGLGVTSIPSFETVNLFPYRAQYDSFILPYPHVSLLATEQEVWGSLGLELSLIDLKNGAFASSSGHVRVQASRPIDNRFSATLGLTAARTIYSDKHEDLQITTVTAEAGITMVFQNK